MKSKYLIIGAGVHGLSTAWHLAEKLKATNLRNADRKLLMDAMMVTIAGISAAMKNTG